MAFLVPYVNEIKVIDITLSAEGDLILWIILADDGLVHRMGSGSLLDKDLDVFIGLSNEPLFDELRSYVSAEMLDNAGVYSDPNYKGIPSNLIITFLDNGPGVLIEYNYGSESVGPPRDIQSFVRAAIAITNDWQIEQKRIRDLNAPQK